MTPAEKARVDQILAHGAEHVDDLVEIARDMLTAGVSYEEAVANITTSGQGGHMPKDHMALVLAVAIVRLAQQEVTT